MDCLFGVKVSAVASVLMSADARLLLAFSSPLAYPSPYAKRRQAVPPFGAVELSLPGDRGSWFADDGAHLRLWPAPGADRRPGGFPREVRDRIASIRDKLQPTDPVLRHSWLFAQHVELEKPNPIENFEAHERAVHAARLEALRQITSAAGVEGVFRLLSLAQDPSNVGWIIGQERLLSSNEVGLPAVLDTTDNQRLAFTHSYIRARHVREGWAFVHALPLVEWAPRQVATFARCLPFAGEVWRWLEQFGTAAVNEYWRRIQGFLAERDAIQAQIACRSLIKVGRPFTAVNVLCSASFREVALPSNLIAESLEATFTAESSDDIAAARGVQYEVQQLIKSLQHDKEFDRARLARIEWGLLPLLDRDSSAVGPDTLVREVEANPDSFVHLLTLSYRGENEPPRETPPQEQEQLRARYARTLLDSLARLPGTNDANVLDYDHLRYWTEQVRLKAAECHRLAICDETLGQLFARASKRPDETWPPPDLAALMEKVGSEEFFQGVVIGVLNSRGVVSRSPWEGGEQERSEADRFRHLAQHVRPASPKLAEAFLRLAQSQDHAARGEDEDAERRKLGR